MVASGQVEVPFLKGIGRQRGWGHGALAHISGRTEILFLRKQIVTASKHVGIDLLEFPVPENTNVVIGRRNFQGTANSVGKQTLGKQLGGGSEKGVQAKSFQQNLQNKPVCCEETFLQTFLNNHFE